MVPRASMPRLRAGQRRQGRVAGLGASGYGHGSLEFGVISV